MKVKSLLGLLLVLSAGNVFSQSLIRTSVEEILTSVTYFTSMYPRLEGAPSETRTISYITDELDLYGVNYTLRNFGEMDRNHSFSKIIEAELKGESPETLVIVVPLNHPRDVENTEDGSINLGLALGILKEFSKRQLSITVKVLFLGAEFGSTKDYPLGTKQFLSNFFPQSNHIFMYLNLRKLPARLSIKSGGNGIVSPYWLIERTRQALDAGGLFYLLKGNENQLYRLSLWEEDPIIDDYLKSGYPAISIEGIYDDERIRVSEWYHSFFLFLDTFIKLNSSGFKEEWDKHYLFFQIRSLSLIIPEKVYLILFIIAVSIPLAYPFLFTRRFKHYLRSLARNFWDIPVLFILVYLFFLAGTGLVYMLLYMRDAPTLWEKYPFYFFVVKTAITLVLFSFLFGVLKKIPFSKNSTFYTSSALLILIVNIFVVSTRNISLSYYLIWALFFCFLLTLSRYKWLKILNFLLSMAFLIKLLIDVFSAQSLPIIKFLLISPVYGNLLLTVNILPYLFFLIRIDFLFRHKALQQQKLFVRSFGVIVGLITLGILIRLLYAQPYSEENPQPINVVQYRNLNTDELEIRISSEAPFSSLLLGIKELGYPIISGFKEYKTVVYSFEDPISISVESREFLGRENMKVSILSEKTIETIKLAFNIEDPIIYDSNYPYTLSPEENTAVLHIGKSPPNPLIIELTLPKDDLREIDISGTLATNFDDNIIVTGRNIDVNVENNFSYLFDL